MAVSAGRTALGFPNAISVAARRLAIGGTLELSASSFWVSGECFRASVCRSGCPAVVHRTGRAATEAVLLGGVIGLAAFGLSALPHRCRADG